jgi:hypothetical protein
MPITNWQLNPFERILFRVALALGIILVAVRLAAILVIFYVHHSH